MQAEWSGLAMAERNYETVPALRGDAVWETKLDQGDDEVDYDDDDHRLIHVTEDSDDDNDKAETTLF